MITLKELIFYMKIGAVYNTYFTENTNKIKQKNSDTSKNIPTTAKAVLGGVLLAGGALAAYYITKNKNAANKTIQNIEQKLPIKPEDTKALTPFDKIVERAKTSFDNLLSDYEIPLEETKTLPNGDIKLKYKGIKDDGREIKELLIFDKDKNLKLYKSDILTLEKNNAGIPLVFRRNTDMYYADKTMKTIDTEYYLNMQPKKYTVTSSDGKTKTVIYGFDINGDYAGTAYTENDKVILKMKNEKSTSVYESFEDLFNKVDRDDFKMK